MPIEPAIARTIWEIKYRRRRADGEAERSPAETWARVAAALAVPEGGASAAWEKKFRRLLRSGRFLPGGRILAGAGTADPVTLFNCFVLPAPADATFARTLREAEATMRQGGGIGFDMSLTEPGTPGVVARLQQLDAMCETLVAHGARRGAMMAALRCDHPEIVEFIEAKAQAGALRNFNLSAQVTDRFLAAVRADGPWPLVFPEGGPARAGTSARQLWERLLRSTYDSAEPGVLFIDRINGSNNLAYCERVGTTNPCGEVPLPAYGACDLGSLNLPRFVRDPFTPAARVDEPGLAAAAALAVRLLDNVIQVSAFPLVEQARTARRTRRIGLGIMGLADALVMLGLRYDSAAARALAARLMQEIRLTAYRASAALAREKGAFPAFDRERYLERPFIAALPADLRDAIGRDGIRNSHLLAIAPTGSISLLAGGVSSGIEPLIGADYRRTLAGPGGQPRTLELTAYCVALWRGPHGSAGVPPAFRALADISPEDQLAMQAALQAHVDNAIAKTVAVAHDFPFAAFRTLYERADALGLKGCAAFRAGGVRGNVIASHCSGAPG